MTELMGRDEEFSLSERKKKILKAIIDAHIAYGEPVGSKYLAQDADLNCSSATIRNEMAELEALGYSNSRTRRRDASPPNSAIATTSTLCSGTTA